MKAGKKIPSIHLAGHRLCVDEAGDLPHTFGVDHAGTATLVRLGPVRVSLDTARPEPRRPK